jgi:hypothetical protein
MVILGALNIEIWNPAQLSIDVPVLGYSRIVWHSGSLDLVHLVWVMLPSRLNENWLLLLELLVKVLPVVRVVLIVEKRWASVEALVPLIISWSQHSIIGVFLNDELGCCFCVGWVGTSKLGMGFEDVCKSLASKGRLSIQRSHGGSQLWINNNVFGI